MLRRESRPHVKVDLGHESLIDTDETDARDEVRPVTRASGAERLRDAMFLTKLVKNNTPKKTVICTIYPVIGCNS